jgi:alcohol dehydrogenase class IV
MTVPSILEMRKFLAPEFVFGRDVRRLVGNHARNLGVGRALVVTDPGVLAAGWVADATASLDEAGIEHVVFSDVTPNPRASEVAKGAEAFRRHECDALVAVGGGSPMDCAKGIGIVVASGRGILEFEGVDRVAEPMPPMICIPTTSGTSADVSQFAIITNVEERRKIAIISKAVVPDLSLIDPVTLTSMDPYLTACTGLDALTHAVEAIASLGSSVMTRTHALEAIRRLTAHLIAAIESPDDLESRAQVMLGSLHAGLAFSNASLGAVHAMAHSLGGRLDLPHGECNALLIEHVIAFNFDAAPESYGSVGEAMGLPMTGETERERRAAVLDFVRDLRIRAGVHGGLGERRVARTDVGDLSRNALRDACMVTNPRRPAHRDVEVIYEEAL